MDSDAAAGKSHYSSVAINLEHPIRLARIAIRCLIGSNKQGVILNLASDAGTYSYLLICAFVHRNQAWNCGFYSLTGSLRTRERSQSCSDLSWVSLIKPYYHDSSELIS